MAVTGGLLKTNQINRRGVKSRASRPSEPKAIKLVAEGCSREVCGAGSSNLFISASGFRASQETGKVRCDPSLHCGPRSAGDRVRLVLVCTNSTGTHQYGRVSQTVDAFRGDRGMPLHRRGRLHTG